MINISGKAAVVCAGRLPSGKRGARGRAGVGIKAARRAPRTGPPMAGGRRDRRARRWGEQPQPSRPSGRQPWPSWAAGLRLRRAAIKNSTS